MKIKTKAAHPSVRIPHFIPLLLLVVAIAAVTHIYNIQTRPVAESRTTEMKHIPPEIKVPPSKTSVAGTAAVRVPILLYHYVEYVKDRKDKLRIALNIVPSVFDQQVKTLKDAGYTFLTASELADIMDGKEPAPQKPVLLTFDDGHWDLDTDILPILRKYRVNATAYVISGFIGKSDFLSKAQLTDVARSGLVEIGAHTVHHVSLKGKLPPIATLEIRESKREIEQMIGSPVVSFAYPNGSFDQQAIDEVASAGFRTAVSTITGVTASENDRYFLFRVRPGERTGETLIRYLEAQKDPPHVTAYYSPAPGK